MNSPDNFCQVNSLLNNINLNNQFQFSPVQGVIVVRHFNP